MAAAFGLVLSPDLALAQQQKINLCRDGSGDAAIKACSDLIKRGGKDAETYYYNRSRHWETKGDCDLALSDGEKALSLKRDDFNYSRVGEALVNCKNDYEQALPIYDEGIKAWPKSAMLYRGRAALHGARADYDRAVADYDQLIRLEPREAENYLRRGEMYGEVEDWEKAIADLDKVIGMKPASALGYSFRGLAFSKKGQFSKAQSDLDRAVRLDPKNSDPYASRAAHYREMGDYERSLADHAKAIALSRQSINYTARAKTLRLKGDLDLALADTNEAVKLETKPHWSLQQRGIIYRYRGEYDRAIADFDRLLRNYPDTAAAYVERGRAYANKGDLVRARADLERALKERGAQFRTAHEDARAQLAALDAGASAAKPAPVNVAAPANPAPAAPVVAKEQGRRVALVIGNSEYAHSPKLANPVRDAKAVANSLRAVGFQSVTVASDMSREGLMGALRSFAREAEKADWVMVYYAGHGIEVGGVNYLIPVDAKLETDRDASFEAVSLEQVLSAVDGAKKIKLVVLDACRDNPFAAQMRRTVATRSIGRGLGRIEPEGATLVVYAAKHGQTALDGDGNNSPFASALVRRMTIPDIEINKIFRLIRDDVMDATGGRQEPFTYGSLPGREDFFFVTK